VAPPVGLGDPSTLYAVGDRAVLAADAASPGRQPSYWQTADGRTWTEIAAPPGWSAALRPFGRGVVSIPTDGMFAVDLDPDGAGWRRVSLTPLLRDGEVVQQIAPNATSSAGITIAAAVGTQAARPMEDATTAPTSPMATTTTIMEPAPGSTAIVGPQVTDLRWELLHSVDGLSWSRESVAQLAGVGESEISRVTRIQGTPDGGLVVAVNLRTDSTDELPQQIVLVGTPKG